MTDFQIKAGETIAFNDTFDVLELTPDGDQCDIRYAEKEGHRCTFAPLSLENRLIDDRGEYISNDAQYVDCCIYGYVDDAIFYTYDDKAWQAYIEETF